MDFFFFGYQEMGIECNAEDSFYQSKILNASKS